MDPSADRSHPPGALLVSALFVVAIWLPLAAALLRREPPAPTENRPLATRLPLASALADPAAFSRAFEAYWNDAFGLRPRLIQWHHLVCLRFGVSPSDRVAAGRDGWLFLQADFAREYDRAPPYTENELGAWILALDKRSRWVAARGGHYLFVVAPNKETIYPERAPAAIKRRDESRLDQLLARLRAEPVADTIDLRPLLRAAKADGPVYLRTDTHWNDAGAFVAYRAITAHFARWYPALVPLPLSAFDPRRQDDHGGDLALMLGLLDDLPEARVTLVPRRPRLARSRAAGERPAAPRAGQRIVMERPGLGPRAVVFHDSFAWALVPFLSEHFARVVYESRPGFDFTLVEEEHPDVVIQERAERYLMKAP